MSLTHRTKLETQNCTDWHCHLLPGIDDGAATLEESIAMARALSAAGFTKVCCTPHLIKGTYECSAVGIRERTKLLQQQLAAESIPLQLIAGAEYYLDEYLPELLHDPLPLGDSKLLLIEIPGHAPVEFVKETCYLIKGSGYTPLIAHPERCTLLALQEPRGQKKGWKGFLPRAIFASHQSPVTSHQSQLLLYLQEIGCKFQGNLGSFTGYYGERIRLKAEEFLATGIYTHFGSDLHSVQQSEILSERLPLESLPRTQD